MIPAIEEDRRFEPARLQFVRYSGLFSQDLTDTGFAKLAERVEPRVHKWQGGANAAQVLPGHDLRHERVVIRFQQIYAPGFVKVTIVYPQGLLAIVLIVLSPIRGDQVHATIAIEISDCDPVPPARQGVEGGKLRVECCRFGPGNRKVGSRKFAMIVVEDKDGPPFAGQDQFRITITIQITPNRPTDQAHMLE